LIFEVLDFCVCVCLHSVCVYTTVYVYFKGRSAGVGCHSSTVAHMPNSVKGGRGRCKGKGKKKTGGDKGKKSEVQSPDPKPVVTVEEKERDYQRLERKHVTLKRRGKGLQLEDFDGVLSRTMYYK
jgi:hypothetical protein